MLPAPARIASTPRQNSRTCWNPAVPPPPVPGAALGNERADELGDGDGLGLGVVALGAVTPGTVVLGVVTLGVAVPGVAVPGVAVPGVAVPGVAVPGVLALAVAVPGVAVPGVLLEVVALGVPRAEVVGLAGPVPPGENEGGVVDGEPPPQADSDADASMANAAQPRTVPRKRRRP
jgi:hypothetical protein